VDGLLSRLDLDPRVPPSREYVGGPSEASKRYTHFLEEDLNRYADSRNDPVNPAISHMSPYLHFGQVSPVTLARGALEGGGPNSEAFMEELLVRRELSLNFVHYNPRYDSFSCLPSWAMSTLKRHASDPRTYLYTLDELEQAQTHDSCWNAAQNEMVSTGKMQGYLRMYWGKKILEWSATPQEAYRCALYLNNAYELDGRDPNGYAGVAWCFGKHDRPWKERKIFGTVRYMGEAGLRKKFDMGPYVQKYLAFRNG
jgi:deoxyribodipyrimidine photo-lyase